MSEPSLIEQARITVKLQRAGLTDGEGRCKVCAGDVFTTDGTDECRHVHHPERHLDATVPVSVPDTHIDRERNGTVPEDPGEDPGDPVPQGSGNVPGTDDQAQQTARRILAQRIRDGHYLNTTVFPPLQWAVPGLIAEGTGLLTGPPKLGKSWFVLDLALAVASGGRALHAIRVASRPVIYFALEDGDRRMQARARHITGGRDVPDDFTYVLDCRDYYEATALLSVWFDDHPGGVAILDTLYRVAPERRTTQSTYQADYELTAGLKALTDAHPGVTLLLVHHTRKASSGDWADSTSGTNGLNGGADWTVSLTRGRSQGSALINVTGRDVGEGPYAATFDAGLWSLDGADLEEAKAKAVAIEATTGVGDSMTSLVEEVVRHPEGITTSQLAAALSWPMDKTSKYARRAADAERITNPSRGLWKANPTS